MLTWNYCVFREENADYAIREVFYDEEGAVLGCTADPVEPYGESLEELARDIEWFQEALTLPILTLADMPPATSGQLPRDRSKNIPLDQLLAELEADNTDQGAAEGTHQNEEQALRRDT